MINFLIHKSCLIDVKFEIEQREQNGRYLTTLVRTVLQR